MNTAIKRYTNQEIFNEITAYINSTSYSASHWYVGITENINQRLFNDHNVSKEADLWIYFPASSSSDARIIEKALIDWGCDGGTGGGDNNTRYIYAYLKTAKTIR